MLGHLINYLQDLLEERVLRWIQLVFCEVDG
jgi:hypothetical protein